MEAMQWIGQGKRKKETLVDLYDQTRVSLKSDW
jgi:hypothetical protein